MNTDKIHIYNSVVTMNQAVVTRWAAIAAEAIATRGAFHVALAGGNTPKQLYTLLASKEIAASLPWQQTHVYFGDERCVPPDHDDSNFNTARQALLDHIPTPPAQIHRIHGKQTNPTEAALAYDQILRKNLPKDEQGCHFDMILLGLGADGHIASLFPETPILNEKSKLCASVYVDRLSSFRISVTFPVLEQAEHLLLVVAGSDKAEIVNQVFSTTATTDFPVQRIAGRSEWHLDHAAAVLIESEVLSTARVYHDQDTGC